MSAHFGRANVAGLVTVTGLCVWGYVQSGPVLAGGEVQPLPAALGFMAALGGLRIAGGCLNGLASILDWVGSHSATGKSGTARWGQYKELKKELCKDDAGPFWGLSVNKGKKLLIDFSSNAYVVGPSGSGKGHTAVVPMIFLIPHSKIITDFKPELLCICKKGLEALGQKVIKLDPFGLYSDRVGPTDQLNPADVITDNFYRGGDLRNVFSDSGELAMQLYEDPVGSKGDDQFWRSGSRNLIALVTQAVCMLKDYDASLSDVALLLDDQAALELQLCSITGIDPEGNPDPQGLYPFELSEWAHYHDDASLSAYLKAFRAKASGLLKLMFESEKTFSSFLEGARQALEPYGFGQLSSSLGRTSFDFDAIKNGGAPINIFIVGDASRTKTTEKYFGLMQWYMQLKLKRHPNKHVPVYLINDEASNYSIFGLVSLMTWGRGFSIRIIQFFQNFTAYEQKHGKHAVEVFNSESEIKLFLPGQRSAPTIKKIVEMLGEQSLMVASLSADKSGGMRENMSESARPLMTGDEIRRTRNGILIIRQQRPILQKPLSYSEVEPLRKLADINPHHGKAFLNTVKLKLKLPKQ